MKNKITTIITALLLPLMLLVSSAHAVDKMPMHLADLQTLNNAELSELYQYASAFTIPSTAQPGASVLLTGLPLPVPGFTGPSSLLNFFWGGKIFTTDEIGKTSLSNQIFPGTPISFNNVEAEVTLNENSLTKDGEAVISINYQHSNIKLAKSIRDEMRLIAPNLYLGRAYMKNGFLARLLTRQDYSFILWFALEKIE